MEDSSRDGALMGQSEAATFLNANGGVLDASSSVEDLLAHVKTLSPLNQRAISAVVGAAVGDAATRPFHWLYDREKLEGIVGTMDPAFWHQSMSPFYTLPTGRRSCYNDLGYCMLRSIKPYRDDEEIDSTGGFDRSAFISSMQEMFSPGSEYGIALQRRKDKYDPNRRLEEREPVDGPWQQGAVSQFMEHVDKGEEISGGKDSKETDGLCVTIPLICRLAAEGVDAADASLIIGKSSSLLNSNMFAQKHTLAAANVLRDIVLHGARESEDGRTVDRIRSSVLNSISLGDDEENYLETEIEEVFSSFNSGTPHTDSVQKWGRQCANPGSFMGALLAFCTSTSTPIDAAAVSQLGYSAGIRMVIKGGGCNCSRSNLAGALLGAYYGLEGQGEGGEGKSIPLEWIKKTDKINEIIFMAIDRIACEK